MHHGNALLALRAGKPVLVEKPFTMNAAEARELVRVARDATLFLMEAMWTRFLPHVRHDPRADRRPRRRRHRRPPTTGSGSPRTPSFRLFAPELGGGALLDLGVYLVSFASMVLGAPEPDRRPWSTRRSPASTARRRCCSATRAARRPLLTCTLRAKTPTRAAIVGTDARIEIDGALLRAAAFTLIPRGGERPGFEYVARGPRPAAPGRRGRAAAGGRRDREPAHAAGRDRLDHGDHGPGTQRG